MNTEHKGKMQVYGAGIVAICGHDAAGVAGQTGSGDVDRGGRYFEGLRRGFPPG